MIGRLHGVVAEKHPPLLLLDVNGVGYEVEAPMSTFYQLPGVGERALLHTHLMVRDDAQLLFGFASVDERHLFRDLIRVNGIGARLALAILSGITVADFARYVQEGDAAALVRLPGVGRKTAERLIIEMRDRLADWGGEVLTTPIGNGAVAETMHPVKEAVSALITLGYKAPEASRLVSRVEEDGLSGEDMIRAALKLAIK